MNPPSLPDPAGLGPALSALATRDLFRDMSGLAATTALAQAVMGAAQSGAANAAAAATASEQTAAHLFRDIAEIAAKAAAGMKGIPLIGGTSGGVSSLPATPNNVGLAIAGGRDLDRREAEAAERQSSGPAVAPPAPVPRPQGAPASSRARRKTVHEAAVFHGRPPLQEPERARTTEVSLVSTLERNEKRTREAVDVDVDLVFSRAWQPNASELPEEQLLMHVRQGSARSIAGKLQPGVSYTVRAPHLKIRPDAIQTQLQRTFVGLFGRIPQVREQLAELAKLTASALSPEVPVNVTATDVVVPLGKEPLLLDLVFRIESDPSAALELKVNANVDLADLAAGLAGVIGRAQAALAASVRKVTNVAKLGHLNWDVLGFDANAGGTLRYVPELVTHAYLEPRPR